MDAQHDGERSATFIITREHRRFAEFADAVRKHRYIGVCHGSAGVGKTLSARRYAQWDIAETLLTQWGQREDSDATVYAALASSGAVFYTPTVGLTLRELSKELPLLMSRVEICIDQHLQPEGTTTAGKRGKHVGLIIIDEADRLSMTALEYLRDLFDRQSIGLILIGMPGIDKRLSRYPQLYSRVGFAHVYRPLQDEELAFVLTTRWRHLGVELDDADFTDVQAVASIVRLTGGNFRLVHRLLVQIERILRLNGLHAINDDVVEAARSVLVIGAT